jgi:hypothetical protein
MKSLIRTPKFTEFTKDENLTVTGNEEHTEDVEEDTAPLTNSIIDGMPIELMI